MLRVAAQLCPQCGMPLAHHKRMKAMQHDHISASIQGCTFCSPVGGPAEPGACILREGTCGVWLPSYAHSAGCPSPYTAPVIAGLLIYLAAFAPGVGPVPWAVNAELYPQQVRPCVIMLRKCKPSPEGNCLWAIGPWLLARPSAGESPADKQDKQEEVLAAFMS